MHSPGITLWRSKRGGKPRGFVRASWREDGRKVTWDTRTLDEGEALKKAVGELNRRLQTPFAAVIPPQHDVPPSPESRPPIQPDNVAPPPAASSPGRKPITEALSRALSNGGQGPAPAPAAAEETDGRKKARKLYEVFGRLMGTLTEGSLKRACRWAGREPEEMDEDELAMIREGFEEKGADWFGRTNIGPWGKIALGSVAAGAGMYMGGKPIPKPPKELTAADGANVRPEREGGGGGG